MRGVFSVLLLVVLISDWSMAAGGGLSLPRLIQELLSNHPAILAAQDRYAASLNQPGQAGALPDPVVSFVTRNASGNPVPFTALGDDEFSQIGVSWRQEFPYPGKLRLAGEMASQESEASKADIDDVKWGMVTQLKQAYYEYYRSDRSLDLLRESRQSLQSVVDLATARYGSGQGTQQDVLRVQLELSTAEQRVLQSEQERLTAAAAINSLLGREWDAPLLPPRDLAISHVLETEADLEKDLQNTPAQRRLRSIKEKQSLALELARKQKRPDFEGMVEYDNSPNFPDLWTIEFGLKIPLFNRGRIQSGIAEASSNVSAVGRDMEATNREGLLELRKAWIELGSMESLLKFHDSAIVEQARLSMESNMVAYQAGKIDAFTALSSLVTLLEYKMHAVEELAKHESAIARIERVLGRAVRTDAPPDTGHE